MRCPLVLLVALLAACAVDHQAPNGDGGTLDFSIGGIPFNVSSGTALISGTTLGLELSDQADACLAITQIPVGTSTTLSVLVSSLGTGTMTAAIVSGLGPGPGQAVGSIATQAGGLKTGGRIATDGSITWTVNSDASVTIDSLDIGFQNTTDRVTLGNLTVPPCN